MREAINKNPHHALAECCVHWIRFLLCKILPVLGLCGSLLLAALLLWASFISRGTRRNVSLALVSVVSSLCIETLTHSAIGSPWGPPVPLAWLGWEMSGETCAHRWERRLRTAQADVPASSCSAFGTFGRKMKTPRSFSLQCVEVIVCIIWPKEEQVFFQKLSHFKPIYLFIYSLFWDRIWLC